MHGKVTYLVKIKRKDWKDSIEDHFKEAEVRNKGEHLQAGVLIQYRNQATKRKNRRFEELENKDEEKWRTLVELEKQLSGKEEEGRNQIIEINLKNEQVNMNQIQSLKLKATRAGNDDLQKDHTAEMIIHDAVEIANHEEDSNLLRKRLW